jgi:hypothetical protein
MLTTSSQSVNEQIIQNCQKHNTTKCMDDQINWLHDDIDRVFCLPPAFQCVVNTLLPPSAAGVSTMLSALTSRVYIHGEHASTVFGCVHAVHTLCVALPPACAPRAYGISPASIDHGRASALGVLCAQLAVTMPVAGDVQAHAHALNVCARVIAGVCSRNCLYHYLLPRYCRHDERE